MRIVTVPEIKPYECITCGSSTYDRLYVDTTREVALQGRLLGRCYVCQHCVDQLGHELGYISQHQMTVMKEENADLKTEIEQLKTEVSELESKLNVTSQETLETLMSVLSPNAPAVPAKRKPGRPRKIEEVTP